MRNSCPSSTPRRSGERVKTDRRDTSYLASLYAASLMTTINIPDEEQQAIRSIPHCREDMRETLSRTKQQILTCLLTRGFRYPGKTHWTKAFRTYLHQLDQLEQEVRRLEVDLAAAANEAR